MVITPAFVCETSPTNHSPAQQLRNVPTLVAMIRRKKIDEVDNSSSPDLQ
jgi:hypothetical protein